MLEASATPYHREDGASAHAAVALHPRIVELDSRHLLQGQREIVIRHGGELYRLRHTRNDKLILTK